MSAATSTEFTREWELWHEGHERRRADPHGFLAVTGLFWLTEDPVTVPGIPGRWSTGEEGPVVQLGDEEWLEIAGSTVRGRHAFGPIAERGGLTVGFDGGVIEVARRGGRDILRPRRADAPYLRDYPGTAAFEPDAAWRVAATYVPFDTPRTVEVGAAVDELSHVYEAPGAVEFVHEGTVHRLTAFPGHGADDLLILFSDETNGVTTYATHRTVVVTLAPGSTTTEIDFTRAVNLPCAYTDFATCPLPPAENRLPFPVTAGERTPHGRVHGVVAEAGIVPASDAAVV